MTSFVPAHTPWGQAVDYRVPEVRAFAIDNALHWVDHYRFDGLRLDAVHTIPEPGQSLLLSELSRAVGILAAASGRSIHLVLENDDNRASLVQVRLGHAVDDRWLILDGVKPGDRVIVDGFQKFADGDVVSPKLWRETRQSDQSTQAADAARKSSPN